MRWAVVLALAVSGVASAATVTERTLTLALTDTGFVEHEKRVVLLQSSADLDAFREYEIHLDEHVTLTSSSATVFSPSGRKVATVPQRSYRREDSTGFGLYTSAYTMVISFPRLDVGQSIVVEIVRRHQPPFLSTRVELQLEEPQERLRVVVRGARERLRWKLHDTSGTMSERIGPESSTVSGEKVPARSRTEVNNAFLQISWDQRTRWHEVGTWYAEIVSRTDSSGDGVRRRAQELCDPAKSRRACFEALADFVRREIRYEAVSIGEGGWVPTTPEDVMSRGWGDCKDKSLLLSRMLREVEIPSWLALIRSGRGRGVDPDFASPNGFNHCIVAVGAGELEVLPSEPVVDGFFLVDPTVGVGTVSWLSPTVRGRHALVVSSSESRLISIPETPAQEVRTLKVSGRVDENGTLDANAVLTLSGLQAVPWLVQGETENTALNRRAQRRLVDPLFPGASVHVLAIEAGSGPAPSTVVRAHIEIDDAIRGEEGRRWFRPALLSGLPPPRRLEGPQGFIRLNAGTTSTQWRLEVPAGWCPVNPRSDSASGAIGHTRLEVDADGDKLLKIDSETVLMSSLIGADELSVVHSLAVAERRAALRRVRFRCR